LTHGEIMECAICRKQERSKTRCIEGYYVCSECHIQGMDSIFALCLSETSRNPIAILEAYSRGIYAGNILDLLEPNYAALFYPTVLNNRAFPEEYWQIRHNCKKNCESCGYCKAVYKQIAETIADIYFSENDIEEDDASC